MGKSCQLPQSTDVVLMPYIIKPLKCKDFFVFSLLFTSHILFAMQKQTVFVSQRTVPVTSNS